MEQIFFYFFSPSTSAFASHTFLINLKLLLKQLDVKVEFFNTGNLHKNLYKPILKYILDRLRPIGSKSSSLSMNLFNNSPCLPTILIIFLFAPFKISSYFFTKDKPAFSSLNFLPPHSCVNNPLLHRKLLILMREVLV